MYLGLVAIVACLAGSLVLFGAGCVDPQKDSFVPLSMEKSPAALRTAVVKASEEKGRATLSTLRESSFAHFSLTYPSRWSVEHWDEGITMRDPKSGEYTSIFLQSKVIKAASDETVVVVSGQPASQYIETSSAGEQITVVRVPMANGTVLELNGNGAVFPTIVRSLSFGADTIPDTSGASGQFCAQKLAYAQEKRGSACEAFPTPCAVPAGWRTCTP